MHAIVGLSALLFALLFAMGLTAALGAYASLLLTPRLERRAGPKPGARH